MDPALPETRETTEADGFAFMGIGPELSSRGDVLKLANPVELLARAPINAIKPFAEDLVDYVLAEQERVWGKRREVK